ncbi:MAG: hypothetical protein LC789_18735 [Actinobacteria bacterium]|nr:hypothetical protein [Actinomycetota bacterium]
MERVTIDAITLEGGRRFPLAEKLASFSTYNLEPIPLVHRVGQFVHLGLDDGAVTWVATIGAVVELDGRTVVYTGELVQVDGGRRAIFADGTVLGIGEGVEPPSPPAYVRVEIDPTSGLATAMTN